MVGVLLLARRDERRFCSDALQFLGQVGKQIAVAVEYAKAVAEIAVLKAGHAAVLARRKGVRLHTHGSETVEEEEFCHELFGMGPTDYFESTGWLGDDVWMAHCVHMNDSDIAAFARTGTGVAHCPSSNARLAAGIARVIRVAALMGKHARFAGVVVGGRHGREDGP